MLWNVFTKVWSGEEMGKIVEAHVHGVKGRRCKVVPDYVDVGKDNPSHGVVEKMYFYGSVWKEVKTETF